MCLCEWNERILVRWADPNDTTVISLQIDISQILNSCYLICILEKFKEAT